MKVNRKSHLLLAGPYFVLGLVALAILWCQLKSRGLVLDKDFVFHTNQFYEAAMQIKTGHLSWFLSCFSFRQSGRVINAVYGPIFSYLMGGLLLLLGSWFRFQVTFELAVLVLSGAFMYHVARDLSLKPGLSLILGVIYMTSAPVTTFLNSQSFEGVGNVLTPLVIMLGIRLWWTRQIPVIPLAVLMALTFQIHVMTTLELSLALVPFAFVSFIRCRFRRRWLVSFAEAVLFFLALTCNVWGTILDVFDGNHVIKPFPNVKVDQVNSTLGWFNGQFLPLNNFFIGILAVLVILILLNWRHLTLGRLLLPLLAALFTLLASDCFPWPWVYRHFPALSQTVQFPIRFLGVAVVCLLLAVGLSLRDLATSANLVRSVVSLVLALGLVLCALDSIRVERGDFGNLCSWRNQRDVMVGEGIPAVKKNYWAYQRLSNGALGLAPHDMVKPLPDYLPASRSVSARNYFQIGPYGSTLKYLFGYQLVNRMNGRKRVKVLRPVTVNPGIHFKKAVVRHGLVVRWHQPRREKIVLPVVKYFHTVVVMDHHPLRHVKINRVGMMTLTPRAGVHRLSIRYQASGWWKLGMLITALSWLWLLIVW